MHEHVGIDSLAERPRLVGSIGFDRAPFDPEQWS
jgi:hypothetical protein